MGVREHIQAERARKKVKRPLYPTLFERIGAIVQGHRLREDFLAYAQNLAGDPLPAATAWAAAQKRRLEQPLFVLCTAEEYQLVTEIIAEFDNPYLPYADSPEEIALSVPLFDADPNLSRELLRRCHFGRLLADRWRGPTPEGVLDRKNH